MKHLVVIAIALAACRGGEDNGPADAAVGPMPDVPIQTIDTLRFGVVGDTRPVNEDDTGNYPTAVITKIWQDVAAAQPPTTFAISTGDYMFASTTGSEQAHQLDLYLGARNVYPSTVYAAMGNHECTGATASNCGPGTQGGITPNYEQYLSRMVTPLGFQKPWFDAYYKASDGSWTAKVVVIAANAWNAEQAAWLEAALSVPSTYTFVVRHEGDSADTAPGVIPSHAIIAKHPLTLQIVGHTHTYDHRFGQREVIIGNGGAPLTGGADYGYVIVERKSDGTIQLTSYDYMSNATVDAFVVGADGAPK